MCPNYGTEKIPNLFIVGAPRCGTTSLAYYLSQHPEIYFYVLKEPMFFANDIKDKPQHKVQIVHAYYSFLEDKWIA